MNETLKGVANIGAELAAAKADLQREMERHRKTWTQLEQVTGLLREAAKFIDTGDMRGLNMIEVHAALSQQAEPALAAVPDSGDAFYAGLYKKSAPMWHRLHDLAVSKGYDHVRFAIECAPVYKCDCMGARKVAIDMAGNTIPCECVAAANETEPAPAQDEREAVQVVGYHQPNRNALEHADTVTFPELYDALMTVAQHERIVAALTRPAQTEQKPKYGTYTTNPGESLMGIANRELRSSDRWTDIRDLNAHTFPDMGPHDYYPVGTVLTMPAAPIAQTAPQPEKSGRYTCIGKGGEYELIGRATTAGSLKMTGRFADEVIVYRDVISGDLYCRTPGDFRLRMGRTTPSPAMDAKGATHE